MGLKLFTLFSCFLIVFSTPVVDKNDSINTEGLKYFTAEDIEKLHEELQQEIIQDDLRGLGHADNFLENIIELSILEDELKNNKNLGDKELIFAYQSYLDLQKVTTTTAKALQEVLLSKIGDIADEFSTWDVIQKKISYGDIVEFKRVGFSHFSVFIGNSEVISFEPVYEEGFSYRNVLSNVKSVTTVKNIEEVAGDSLMRINNKQKNNFPVFMPLIRSRVESAIQSSGSTSYNAFLYNCESFATYIRFGVPLSDQINYAVVIAKEASVSLFKYVFKFFF